MYVNFYVMILVAVMISLLSMQYRLLRPSPCLVPHVKAVYIHVMIILDAVPTKRKVLATKNTVCDEQVRGELFVYEASICSLKESAECRSEDSASHKTKNASTSYFV